MLYYSDDFYSIYNGDSLEILKKLPEESVNCIVTSPPYWALRDYGVEGQIGLEKKLEEYIVKLCNIFDEVKRILKKDGTCWVNLGDTYMGNSSYSEKGRQGFNNDKTGMINKKTWVDPKYPHKEKLRVREHVLPSNIQSKSLCMVPSRFAIEMINRGWVLRNEIIWHKPNCMPSSVKDRFTVDFEKVFFFVKNKEYFFEQQVEKYTSPLNRWGGEKVKAEGISSWDKGVGQETYRKRDLRPNKEGKNKRTTWSIPTKPNMDSHFATYPKKLVEPCILAGCPVGGVVLDPFVGSGTTLLVAKLNGRKGIGIELNKEYCDIVVKNINKYQYIKKERTLF